VGAHDDSPASETSAVDADHPPVYPRPPVVTSLDYSPDGELLAVSGYHEVLLHRSDGSGLVARLVGLAERIESVAFSPDGRSLAVVGGSPARMGEVQIWDVKTRELELSRTLTYDCLFGASWSHDSKLLAFGATDTAVRAIDAATGEQVLFQGAHDDWVLDTVFSTDASHLVTVSRDRSMKLIDVPHEQFIDNITSITPGALKGGLMAVARHPTRDELLIGGADGVPKIYRMYREKKRVIGDDYNLIRAFDRLPGRVFAVAYSPDGRRIAAGSSHRAGGEVRLFSTEDGALVWSHALRAGVFTLAFRPDGWAIAAGGFDGVVELIDAETGWLTRQFVPVPIETRQE
jgi:WD40 repeat protein